MGYDQMEDTLPDRAAEMAARGARAAGQALQTAKSLQAAHQVAGAVQAAGSTAGAVSGTAVGTALGGPLGAAIGTLVTSKTFWKIIGGILAAVLLFLFILANSVSIILTYLGFEDADSYVSQARAGEYEEIEARIAGLFTADPALRDRVWAVIEEQRDILYEEIENDFSSSQSGYDSYSVADETDTVLLANLERYLAVLIEEEWHGSRIVEFDGYSPGSGTADASAISGEMLMDFAADRADSFMDWAVTGHHTDQVGTEDEPEEISFLDYSIVVTLNMEIAETQTGYEFRTVTDETALNHVLGLFELVNDGIDNIRDVLFSASSWKNLIIGEGASEDICENRIDAEGDVLTYDTVTGCVREVTYFNQGVEPWRSVPYGNGLMKDKGCGPAAMAIVISTLTGENVTPQMTAEFAMSRGYYVQDRGTSHGLPSAAAANWGLSAERVNREQISHVKNELRQGKLAVVICAENTISTGGHYIVLTGLTADGYFTIADPGSRSRTGNLYSPATIQSYARNLSEGSIWIIGEE